MVFFGGLKKAGKVTQILARIHTVQQGIRTLQVRRPQVETGLTRVAYRGILQREITCLRVKETNLDQGPVNDRKVH